MKLNKTRTAQILEYAILLPCAGVLLGGLAGFIVSFGLNFLHYNIAQRKLFLFALIGFGAFIGVMTAIDFIIKTIKMYNILDNEKKPEEIKNNTVK